MKGIYAYLLTGLIQAAFLLAFTACRDDSEGKSGSQILSRDEMVQVLADIYIAEEKVNRLLLSRDSSEFVFETMKDKVYARTGVSDSVFRNSFDYYMNKPKEMELIFTALVDTLQLREQRAPFTPPGMNAQ